MNPQNYTINIRPGWGISQVVKVSQGDVGRPLTFTIMDGQDALTIASGTTVTIKGTKPSTLGFTQACELSGNTASVETTATMTQEAGAVQAELILTQGTTIIGSANFVMYVEPAAHPEGTTDGDAETARDLMTRAQAAVTQAEAEADRAEGAAESIAQAGISTVGATAGQVPTANGAGGWSWQDQQGGGGTSDDIENKSSVSGATVTGALNSLSDEIASLSGGAPTPAATVSEMVDTTKIYLYTGSETGYTAGHWYYYSGGQWVDGGAYGEAASMSAGVKAALLACFRNVAWIDENGQTYYDNLYNELYPPANLVSITATYTQSGTMYETTSLDDLKTDLVVTANYSDGTSETVTAYTLSGTLAEGTSTITVAYGGKTTTFDVTVSRELDYTADALADVTWNDGYGYTTSSGVLTTRSGAYSTDKFSVQDLSYSVRNLDTSNNTNFYIYVWDENGTYLGNKQFSDARFQWKPEYKIAIEVRNSGTFDPTTITMLPYDKRATAVSEFEINLASMANSVVKANGYYELNVNAVMANAGVNSSNYNDAINRQSIVGMINQSVHANNFPFKTPIRIGTFNYGTNMLLSINVKGIAVSDANLPTLKAYLVDNNVKIKYNY